MKKIILSLILAITLSGLAFGTLIQPAYALKTINDNATGGDCSTIGTWSATYKTCTLGVDLTEGIVIVSNSITLDGNGHTITGIPNKDMVSFNQNGVNIGIFLNSISGVTIQNTNVKNFGYGIALQNSNSDIITNNISSGNIRDGIFLLGSSSNTISYNTLYGNITPNVSLGIDVSTNSNNNNLNNNKAYSNNGGIEVDGSSNTITKNTVNSNTVLGIYLNNGAKNNVLNDNTISNNGIGINLDQSTSNNKIYNNNFVDNQKDAESNANSFSGLAIFNLSVPVGGNYWSDFNSTSKGCNDVNFDNFCDSTSVVTKQNTIPDSLSWNFLNGWHTVFTTTGNIIAEAQSPSGNVITYIVSANKDGSPLSVTCNPTSGSTFPISSTMVVCTASNGRTTSFNVKVQDTTTPTVVAPANQVVNETTTTGAIVSYPVPTATDIVGVVGSPTCDPPAGSTFGIGVTTVTCKASDAAGNVGIAKFTITVKDNIPPTITAQNLSTQVSSKSGGSINYQLPQATDNVGVTNESCNPASGSNFAVGNTTVTCTASDAAGNKGTTSFTVQVKYIPPSLQLPLPPTNLVATPKSSSSIHLSWNSSLNATSYNILRANSATSIYNKIAAGIPTTSFDDIGLTASTTYYYEVVAVNTAGSSSPSNAIWATTLAQIQPVQNTMSSTNNTAQNTSIQTSQTQPNSNMATLQNPPVQNIQNEIDISSGSGSSASAACVATNNCFSPNPITVAPGTEVDWKNADTLSHTVTSGKVSDDSAGSLFDSGLIRSGGDFKFTFANAGTYDYYCTVHPWMTGQIVVSGSNQQPRYQPPPQQSLPITPSGVDISISPGAGTSASTSCVSTNNCFSPNSFFVNVGHMVTWFNGDTLSHTITSGHVYDNNAGSLFDSGLIRSGGEFKFTFQNSGTYNYFCTVHPWMTGQVIVGSGISTTPHLLANPTQQDLNSINQAKTSQTIAAEVNVGNDKTETKSIDNSVSVQTTSSTSDSLGVRVSAPDQTGPKVIVFNLNATTINVANLKDLGVEYDGKLLSPAPNMDAILHAKSTDNPSFAIVVTQSGVQVMVLVPHFSTHSITITNMSKVIPAIPEFPISLLVLLIAIASTILFYRIKPMIL